MIDPARVRAAFTIPNLLSAARIPLGLIYTQVVDRPRAGAAVLGAAWLTDVLDGFVARRYHSGTSLGSAIDSTADKVFAMCVVGALLHSGRLSPGSAALLFTRELGELVLALDILVHPGMLRGWTHRERASALGKFTTGAQYAALIAAQLGLPRATRALAWTTGAMGALAALAYWAREKHASSSSPAPPTS